jgi:hypothetical protein
MPFPRSCDAQTLFLLFSLQVLQYKEGISYTGPIATSTEVVDWGQGGLKYFAAIIKYVSRTAVY